MLYISPQEKDRLRELAYITRKSQSDLARKAFALLFAREKHTVITPTAPVPPTVATKED